MTGRVAAAADGPHGLLEAAQGWGHLSAGTPWPGYLSPGLSSPRSRPGQQSCFRPVGCSVIQPEGGARAAAGWVRAERAVAGI